ncbi:MAG: cell division protein ZapA [Bryobacterales bacterium]|jgi:cell division protein ZapA (FtsZ GTPase activity inhibitor)|nr:cell division protein ZapA [Bryobacterales bacterium]
MNSEPTPKQVFRVTIFNQTLSITSSTSAAEFHHLASQVDALMGMIASKSGTADGARVGVLAAMHLADRLHQAERKLESAQHSLTETKQQVLQDDAQARTAAEEAAAAVRSLREASAQVATLTRQLHEAQHQQALLEAELTSARGSLSGAQAALAAAESALAATRAELEEERMRIGRDAGRLHHLLQQALDPASTTPAAEVVASAAAGAIALTKSAPAQTPQTFPAPGAAAPVAPLPRTRDLFSFDDSDLTQGATA